MGPVFNPANAVTASRFITLPLFFQFYTEGNIQFAALMVLISGIIDKFDGLVARIFNCSSGFGELFDAATDAICYAFYVIVVVLYDPDVSWIPVAMILGLGALNTVFRIIYAKRAGRATNYHSYAMERHVGYLAYAVGGAVVGYEASWFLWTCAFFLIVILARDTKRMLIDPVPA